MATTIAAPAKVEDTSKSDTSSPETPPHQTTSLAWRLRRFLRLPQKIARRDVRLGAPAADVSGEQVADLLTDTVLVSDFAVCNGLCPGQEAFHLSVTTHHSIVEEGRAVALSYAIGDFDRQYHVVGHFKDEVERPVTLQLGGEWDVAGFKQTLADMSNAKNAVWLDQISIKQIPDEIPAQLHRIPHIFGTFEVVVLMPRPPCSCLRDTPLDPDDPASLAEIYLSCLNAFPMSSYQQRLWTKQEFGYAEAISVSYCHTDTPQCSKNVVKWPPNHSDQDKAFRYMSRYCKYLYDYYLAQTTRHALQHPSAVWSLLRTHLINSIINQTFLLQIFYLRGATQIHPSHTAAQFLLGVAFGRKKTKFDNKIQLGLMQGFVHRATVAQDYVLTTFLQSNYRIPSNLALASLQELADDAIERYQLLAQITQFSRLPSGLFELAGSTTRCRPSLYLSGDADVESVADVWGPFETAWRKSLTPSGEVMLTVRHNPKTLGSRMSRASSYEKFFHGRNTNDCLHFLRGAQDCASEFSSTSSPDPFEQMALEIVRGSAEAPEEMWQRPGLAASVFRLLLAVKGPEDWRNFPEVDHHSLVYDMMAKWACIRVDTCRAKGIGLVVVEEPPCIGFVNGTFYKYLRLIETQSSSTPSSKLEADAQLLEAEVLFQRVSLLTVNMAPRSSTDQVLTYEAVTFGSTFELQTMRPPTVRRLPSYMVLGVWYYGDPNDPLIGASATEDGEEGNAVLL